MIPIEVPEQERSTLLVRTQSSDVSQEFSTPEREEFFTPEREVRTPRHLVGRNVQFSPSAVSTPLSPAKGTDVYRRESLQSVPIAPRVVPAGLVQSPGSPVTPVRTAPRQVSVPINPNIKAPDRIHPELRSHCKSGPKDIVPKDISGPMTTRSGKKLQE